MIAGLQDVYYYVKDMRRAVRFYRDTLGLRMLSESDHWSAFDIGGVRLGLHMAEGNVISSSADGRGVCAGATVTLKARDIRHEVERLQRAGVRFLGEVQDHPWGTIGAFQDPDGNVVKVMEPNAV